MDTGDVPLDDLEVLPVYLRDALKKDGIISLRKFQVKGILMGIMGNNLVIVAPTGSGKTLVGEIIAILNIANGGKSLFLVPYKALAEEMKNNLQRRYPFVRIGISTGDYREKSLKRVGIESDLIILTYEKADLLRREMPPWMNRVKTVIIDEIHLLNDFSRGSLLDSVITALKAMNYQIIGLSATIPNGDEIAEWLNASLIISNFRPVKLLEGVYLPKEGYIYFHDPNPSETEFIVIENKNGEDKLSKEIKQINLDSYLSKEKNYLEEQIRETLGENVEINVIRHQKVIPVKREVFRNNLTKQIKEIMKEKSFEGDIICVKVLKSPIRLKSSISPILDLIYDLLSKSMKYGTNWQILIFRRSRHLAQTTAKKIALFMKRTGLSKYYLNHTRDIIDKLTKLTEVTSLTEELKELIINGVAFHHAGLGYEERKIIEDSFRQRRLGIIVATPTLGAGINVPARRVVIETLFYDPIYGYQHISVAHYKQRAGRAGRPGLDSIGEAILIAKNEEAVLDLFQKYIFGSPEMIKSHLGHNLPAIRQQLLAYIAAQKNPLTLQDILGFFQETFFYWQCRKYRDYFCMRDLESNLKNGLRNLVEWEFISEDRSSSKTPVYKATQIGIRVSRLYLDPMSAHIIINVMRNWGRTSAKMQLHNLLIAISKTPDINNFRRRILSNLVRLSSFISNLPEKLLDTMRNWVNDHLFNLIKLISQEHYYECSASEEEEIASIGLVSMILLWINGRPLKEILDPFTPNFGPGDFRELVRLFEWLLYCAKEIARIIKLPPNVIKQIEILRQRVQHGVTEELLELVSIPGIGRVRARILARHGFRSLHDLSKADLSKLTKIPGIGTRIAERILDYVKRKQNLS